MKCTFNAPAVPEHFAREAPAHAATQPVRARG